MCGAFVPLSPPPLLAPAVRSQALAARDAHISDLQAQLQLLGDAEGLRLGEHQAHVAALMASFNELRASCEMQVRGARLGGRLGAPAAGE